MPRWKNVGGRIEARQGGQDIVRGKERGQIVGGGGGGARTEQANARKVVGGEE